MALPRHRARLVLQPGRRGQKRAQLADVGLTPSAAVLQPCAAHVASASDSLRQLERQLADRASLDSDVAAATTTLVADAAAELRAAFAFVDQLEESTMALAGEFNEKMSAIESSDEPKAPVTSTSDDEPKRKPRRRRGTELTLDD